MKLFFEKDTQAVILTKTRRTNEYKLDRKTEHIGQPDLEGGVRGNFLRIFIVLENYSIRQGTIRSFDTFDH